MSDQVERVEAARPRWQVWQSDDTGLWWASVRVNLTPNQQRAGCVPHLYAETLTELDNRLREEDHRANSVSRTSTSVPMRVRVWGFTEADTENALYKAGQGWARESWEFTEVERHTCATRPFSVTDPKAVAADAGYHWSYIVYVPENTNG